MGREIERDHFDQADVDAFEERLRAGLAALGALLERPGFGAGPLSIGAELELALVDGEGRAAPLNEELLASLPPERWASELNRFNIEYCTRPAPLAGRPFTILGGELAGALDGIGAVAAERGSRAVAIGILPTLEPGDLGPGALTESHRFRALDAGLERFKPTDLLQIEGPEPLSVTLEGISAEGANAALQLHLQVPPEDFARTFNAAQMATAPALALAVNSPTFLGHILWEETRVPLFHQAVDGHDGSATAFRPYRVAFGHGWVRDGALELFEECVALHPPLIPISGDGDDLADVAEGRSPELAELRLHSGTTWRWNRPVYDPADGGHLRIEFRALPAGPTVPDMLANAAFLVGLTLALREETWMPVAFPFGGARRNFFQAALRGLDATLVWPSPRAPSPVARPAVDLARALIPRAREGLAGAGVDAGEVDDLLGIVDERLATRVTGARWQRETLRAHQRRMPRRRALAAMLERYLELADLGEPVHRWPMPGRRRAAALSGRT
jgi:hypothetical protein